MPAPLDFNSRRDTDFAHMHAQFPQALHLFHAQWHGIRSACACLPGHKLAISHEGELDGECIRHAIGLVHRHRIRRICFQGASPNALALAREFRNEFGSELMMVGITHVNAAQFEHRFEIEMQALLIKSLERGVLDRLASVKPGFSSVVPGYWPHTIYNCAPNISQFAVSEPDPRAVFIPLENTWRKNLYTNVLAACSAPGVDRVFSVNWPSGLEAIADLRKLQLTGYLRGMNLYAFMGTMGCLLNASLAECQPMTQLEALAMGTPCITGPLRLPAMQHHPLTALSEVSYLDSPVEIRAALERILALRERDAPGFRAMTADYLNARLSACIDSYQKLLER